MALVLSPILTFMYTDTHYDIINFGCMHVDLGVFVYAATFLNAVV